MQLTYGSSDAFDSLVYGEKHPNTVQFLRDQITSASNMLTSAGMSFYDSAKKAFEHYNGSGAINFARNVIKTITGGNTDIQVILYLGELEQLQKATVLMQRWLMACPVVREKYLDQKIDGYSDTYTNVFGTDVGWKHYDYRRATEGLMIFDEEGNESYTQYFDDLIEGDRRLTISEQIDIQDSWSAMNVFLMLGDDPTNPFGGST